MLRSTYISLITLLFVFPTEKLSAVVLDWDTVTWTPGSLSNSYDIDPAKAGNDVTFTISGNTNRLRTTIGAPNPQTPAITNMFAGGMTPAQNSLHIALDLLSNAESVTVTLDFSSLYPAGIYNLSFTLFDVDYSNASGNTYQDEISNIHGVAADGTLLAPSIVTSISNTLVGTGLGQTVEGTASVPDTGAGSEAGNVTINFGNVAIRSFTFTYGSSSAFANPTYQHVGFWDFSYSPVPEINPAWGAILSSIGAAGLVFRHRAKFRK